jgi:hypothetical protein
MSSFTLNLNSSDTSAVGVSGDFNVKLNTPIYLGRDEYEIALVSCNLWYSYPNVSANSYNNARFTYSDDAGATWYNIDFPEGTYTITDLNSYIYDQLVLNGHADVDMNGIPSIILRPNYNTLKIEIEITEVNFQVDLGTSNFYMLLGFSTLQSATPLTAIGVYEGDELANINNDINKLTIGTSLLSTSTSTFDNSQKGTTLYSFVPNNAPGSNLDVVPSERLYIPMNADVQITNIRMYLRDNLGRALDFRGEPVSYLLHIRKIK